MHGIFISRPTEGQIFVAERSRKGSVKLLWSVMPGLGGADIRIDAAEVPYHIRRQAYRWLAKEAT